MKPFEGTCKVEVKCKQIHGWAHACLDDLGIKDLHQAHELGNKILEMLNNLTDTTNAVKFIAMFEVLSVGADVLDHDLAVAEMSNGTVTIH